MKMIMLAVVSAAALVALVIAAPQACDDYRGPSARVGDVLLLGGCPTRGRGSP